jgi:hypothetical protein
MMEVLTESEGRMREAGSKKIFLEVALMKALQARKAVALDTVLHQLKQLRSGGPAPASGGEAPRPAAVAPSPAPAPAVAPSPAPAPSVAAPRPAVAPATRPAVAPARPAPPAPQAASAPMPIASAVVDVSSAVDVEPEPEPEPASAPAAAPAGGIESLWPQLLDAVGRVSPFTRSYLLEAFPASLKGNVFSIGFEPEFADHIDLVNNTKNIEVLQTKLKELGYPGVYVKFVKAQAPAGWNRAAASATVSAAPETPRAPAASPASPSPAPAPGSAKPSASAPAAAEPARPPAAPVQMDPSEFKNDPLIQKALEIFRGRIIEVRA